MMPERPRISLCYASHDGQTRKIVDRLAGHLAEHGVDAPTADLSANPSPAIDTAADLVLLVAPIRYGFHLPAARRFLDRLRKVVPDSRIVVVSINLTARKPGRQTAEGNVYLRKWLKRTGLNPALAVAVAGKLDYPSYRWFDRTMIRAIMTISGGPTDPSTVIEYTDWAAVESLSAELAMLTKAAP